MTPEEAFLEQIAAAPDDDAPRLVYADWLEENAGVDGAVRAEFIRAQVERHRLPPDDPRQSELEAREHRLLAKHPPLPTGVRGVCYFHRGLPEGLRVDAEWFAQDGAAVLRRLPIRHLWLQRSESRMGDEPGRGDQLGRRLAALPELARVRTLRLDRAVSMDADWSPQALLPFLTESPHLRQLRSLEISSLLLDDATAARVVRSPALSGLESLSLTGALTDESLRALIERPPLTRLALTGLYLPPDDWEDTL